MAARTTIVIVAFLATTPIWLPDMVTSLRIWLFARINGREGILVPGPRIGPEKFKELYAHPAAVGRSKGAKLSDLFWYWLAPGPELHQEHLEPGERYAAAARATRAILARSKKNCAPEILRSLRLVTAGRSGFIRLRDEFMPAWADFYFRAVFGAEPTATERRAIVANARDVVNALKLTSFRHLRARERLTELLLKRIECASTRPVLPEGYSAREAALHLQGVFFNTAIVQSSEALAHLLMNLALNPEVQTELAKNPADSAAWHRALAETFRLHPLFGVAHRILRADIKVDERTTLPRGTVLCFDFEAYHHSGFPDADRFLPQRWLALSERDAHYLPFGSPSNRACPAQAVAEETIIAAAAELIGRFRFHSAARHARSLANRGPCWIEPRDAPERRGRRVAAVAFINVRDRFEDVARSVAQLAFGIAMVVDARRAKPCERHFASAPDRGEPVQKSCPFAKAPQR